MHLFDIDIAGGQRFMECIYIIKTTQHGTVFGYSWGEIRARAHSGRKNERAPQRRNREVMTMMTYLIVCGMLVGLFLLILAYSYLVAINSENEMPDIDDVDCRREKS